MTALVNDLPGHAPALFMLGRLLLARGDGAGVAYLERAMATDHAVTINAAAMIAAYLRSVGRGDKWFYALSGILRGPRR